MRLADFILSNMEKILLEWEQFARAHIPSAKGMNPTELRDHAKQMLEGIAIDLNTAQTMMEQAEKSKGQGPKTKGSSAPEVHALTRLLEGFTIDEMASEYRALRASVLQLWTQDTKKRGSFELEDMTRFNEAIDQALAESIARYSADVNDSRHLFLAILGHDLRTPLGAVSIGAEFLMRVDTFEGQHIKIASRIHRSAQRANEIVDDLLDFTRTQLGASIPIHRTETNLGFVAEYVIEEIRVFHASRKVLFEEQGPLNGDFDGPRIAQVFSNLTANAVQHGAVDSVITVRIQGDAEAIVFSVHNHGPAIPKNELSRIFNPLTRYSEDASAHRGPRSSLGLGLYIVREIVSAHDGAIEVASDEATGTVFTVKLPRRIAASQDSFLA